MNISKLIIRNLKFYFREHILLILGMALSTAVLTAALIIGDSVKFSLNDIVYRRLGNTQQLLITQERFFPASFAATLADELDVPTSSVLLLEGMASVDHSQTRIPNVQICGIDDGFWKMGSSSFPELNDNEVIVNSTLAEKLQLSLGDELFIRIERQSFVTDNAPFTPDENSSIALRMKVAAIANPQEFGDFNIQSNQITPSTVFMSLSRLSSFNFEGEFANLMLIGENSLSTDEIYEGIRSCWTIEVMNFQLKEIAEQGKIELSTDRIFIDEQTIAVLENEQLQPEPVFTYLVNFMRSNNNATPYSFVTALSSYPDHDLRDNEIIINKWLADDLDIGIGDSLLLEYYRIGAFRKLVEHSEQFIVEDVVERSGFAADSLLMPAFEGLAGVESCSDWNAGIPMDFKSIRDKDEEWWKQHKGTPKAFIAYEKALELWSSEYGVATSLRFQPGVGTEQIRQTLLNKLHPTQAGMNVHDIRNESKWSASNAVDFAGLFMALSFFLILAAFMLSALLFAMMIDQRRQEQGIYRSLGIPARKIYRIFFTEGMASAFLGSLMGIIGAVLISQLVLYFLNSIWFDIVRTSAIQIFVSIPTLIMGMLGNLIIAAIVMGWMLKRYFKKQIAALQKQTVNRKDNLKVPKVAALSTTLLFLALFGYTLLAGHYQNATLFLLSGFVLLISLNAWFSYLMHYYEKRTNANMNVLGLAIRNLASNSKRNLTISSIVSIGIFIVISTGANRVDFNSDQNVRQSGTGGYQLWVETNIALNADLSSAEGKNKLAIDESYEHLSIVQLHRNISDDASCLNLNRVIRPTILGVKPEVFIERNAFSFVKTIDKKVLSSWELLQKDMGDAVVPAIADQSVISWGLGKAVGDTIMYLNEKGDSIGLVLMAGLANSVFQGNLIIAEDQFMKHFPSISGSHVMLVEVEGRQLDELEENLNGALRNYGVNIERTGVRLATFNSVTNTYLDIFLALGGIALILGVVGLAIVLIRSINERKNHYAIMQAIGIKKRSIYSLIVIEFVCILAAGTFIGILSAVLAGLSGILAANIPWSLLSWIILLFIVNGMTWILIGARLSMKNNFLVNLKNE